ncbi:MAG: SusC/RagA family TonB-linked outer membrane protein [Prolixibacteraceae bacterium]|nr:SusC/RagA family TonB-linked outer membrane protein [Prolixibacteraceae bacterium]
MLLSVSIIAQEKAEKKKKATEVTIKVTDETGNPISNAQVVVGEGLIHAQTDINGAFTFKGFPDDFVSVVTAGYDKSTLLVDQLLTDNTIKLKKSKLQMNSEDDVPLPFATKKKRFVTGNTSVVSSSQLEKYPSTDLRNALTGLVTGLEVRELNGQPGMSAEESSSRFNFSQKINIGARGRNVMYIIDDIPTDITEMPLDPNEVESVSVVKDIVGKAMFGPAAADGVIFIKTKRGKVNERILNVNVENGVSVIDRFPEWVDGADYARLNNQARIADGLLPRYTEDDISAYALNDPYDRVHPSVNFRKMMTKNSMAMRRINVSSSGGNDRVQYFAYLGYDGEGDIFKIGPVADYNRLNTRSNIDIKINDQIKVQFDFYGGLSYRRSANYGYNSNFTNQDANTNTALSGLEFNSAIQDMTTIPPIAFPVYAVPYDPASGNAPWFGVASSTFTQNPIGNLTNQGFYTESGRSSAANVALEYDLQHLIKGLKSRTYLGFNSYNQLRIGKAEDYIAATAIPSVSTKTGADTILVAVSSSHKAVDQTDLARLNDYYYQRMAIYETLSYDRTFGKHDIQSTLTYFQSKVAKNETEEPQRLQNSVFTGMYAYDNKYILQGVVTYGGTSSFDEGKRYDIFPSIGGAWVMSDEGFMKNVKAVNYFKFRAEYGILGYESFLSPFSYRDRWNSSNNGTLFGPSPTGQWFGNTTETLVYRTSPNRTGNPEITWEKRKEFNAGFDAILLDNKLTVDVTYYNNLREGQISQVNSRVPNIVGVSGALPRFNFNDTRYFGLETGIQYTNNDGKLKYSFGGNATIQDSKYEKFDEPAYRNDYQYRTGKATDVIWGQTYQGRFESDEEALIVPQLFDDKLHKGDLKYTDMNGDGAIDNNDQSVIGHATPRLFYAVNFKLNYKGFELYAMGTGRAFYDIALTNQYFFNGWGDNNYSNFVKDNLGTNYPPLTYNKVNNNFVGSNFWLVKGGFFKVQNVELSYTLPANTLHILGVKGARFFVRGANLLTISKVKDVDPESIDSGVERYPLFGTYTAGVKLTF